MPILSRANPQLKIVLRPTDTFTASGVSAPARVFGRRCAVETSKCLGGAHGAGRRW